MSSSQGGQVTSMPASSQRRLSRERLRSLKRLASRSCPKLDNQNNLPAACFYHSFQLLQVSWPSIIVAVVIVVVLFGLFNMENKSSTIFFPPGKDAVLRGTMQVSLSMRHLHIISLWSNPCYSSKPNQITLSLLQSIKLFVNL